MHMQLGVQVNQGLDDLLAIFKLDAEKVDAVKSKVAAVLLEFEEPINNQMIAALSGDQNALNGVAHLKGQIAARSGELVLEVLPASENEIIRDTVGVVINVAFSALIHGLLRA